MAIRRRKGFNLNIDPELLRTFEAANANDPMYDYELFSGYRPNPSRRYSQHGPNAAGEHPGAIDFNAIDRETGEVLKNIRDPNTAPIYQAAANRWYQSLSPEQQELARWGGYFTDIPDWMHVDFGGANRMGGGDWKSGFNQAQASRYGVSTGGGVEQVAAQMQQQGYSTQQILDALAAIESRGSGDYAATGAWSGDPVEGRDRAYGRYQVMGKNIAPWAEQYLQRKGVTAEQFLADPKLQDELAGAVMSDYRKQYGDRGAFSKWFTGSETEPNRSDVHGKLTGKTYADRAMAELGKMGAAPVGSTYGDSPSEGGARFGGTGLGTPTTEKKKFEPFDYKKFGEKFTAGLGDFGGGPSSAAASGITDLPRAVIAPGTPTTYSSAGPEGEDPRQKLAMAMARLNSGKLWV